MKVGRQLLPQTLKRQFIAPAGIAPENGDAFGQMVHRLGLDPAAALHADQNGCSKDLIVTLQLPQPHTYGDVFRVVTGADDDYSERISVIGLDLDNIAASRVVRRAPRKARAHSV